MPFTWFAKGLKSGVARRGATARRPMAYRPEIECLEERTVLCSTATSGQDGTTLAVHRSSNDQVPGNAHFKRTPTFVDNGLTLTASGSLAGLGNEDATITLRANGSGTTSCRNPSGKVVPGQNKVPITTSVSQVIDATEIKNGTVSFTLTTAAPPNPTAKAAGCPNNNWTATITDVTFTNATIIVSQAGTTVLRQSFTF